MKRTAALLAALCLLAASPALARWEPKYNAGTPVYDSGKANPYPVCQLPAPYATNNLQRTISKSGEFTACVYLSTLPASNQVQAFDLSALQLVVSDKCYGAVKTISLDGKEYTPQLTKYMPEQNIGVKFDGSEYALPTYAELYAKPVQVCITLKFPCANADSLYNIVTYFTGSDYAQCATTSLWNGNYQTAESSPVYATPSPVYAKPSPVYVKPSPVYATPSPVYAKPSPVYVKPSPVYAMPSPVYAKPSPVYVKPSPVYATPSPVYAKPSPVYVKPSPVYATPSPVYAKPSPVYVKPSPVYATPSPVYAEPSPVYGTPSSYPVCQLPAAYKTDNLAYSFGKSGDFTACVSLKGIQATNQIQAFDLSALQLVVSDKCYGAVKSVTVDSMEYNFQLTKYTNEKNVGVKIVDGLRSYAELYAKPAQVCITLKFPCANADSLYNIVTYFTGSDYTQCSTDSLFNQKPQYYNQKPQGY